MELPKQDPRDNVEMFTTDIEQTIQRHVLENDLTYLEIVGALEMLKLQIAVGYYTEPEPE